MREEKIFYPSTDGITLCGLLSEANQSKKITVLCHGIKGDKEECGSFAKLTEALQTAGCNSFRFDFRAHGESSGRYEEMTITKEIQDLECTINMLQNRGFREFILLGASFGAGIISLLEHDALPWIKGLICWYGALDYREIVGDSFFTPENRKIAEEEGFYESKSISSGEIFKFGLPLFQEVDLFVPYEHLMKTELPVLFVHGKEDSLISYHLSEKVSTLCKHTKLELIENGEHSFDQQDLPLKEAIEKTVSFIQNMW